MNKNNIKEIISTEKYHFLRKFEPRLLFLTISGSHAYGTATDESDIDIRGVYYNDLSELVGFGEKKSSFREEQTDTTLYSLNKFMGMLANSNPTAIEILSNKRDMYLMFSEHGEKLLELQPMFLSKKAYNSFKGFANSYALKIKQGIGTGKDRAAYARIMDELMDILQNGRLVIQESENCCPEYYKSLRDGAQASVFLNIIDQYEEAAHLTYENSTIREEPEKYALEQWTMVMNMEHLGVPESKIDEIMTHESLKKYASEGF